MNGERALAWIGAYALVIIASYVIGAYVPDPVQAEIMEGALVVGLTFFACGMVWMFGGWARRRRTKP